MSDITFAQQTIREAFPRERHGSVFAAQLEAYNFLKRHVAKPITLRRVRSLWEGAAKRLDGEEKDALRRAKIEEARREQERLRQRLSELDETLALLDAAMAREAGAGSFAP